jgi:hypothetical protein
MIIRKENQKIDNLLNRFFREEANNFEIPDKERCWQDFQQLLEKGVQERVGISFPADRPAQKNSFYQFILKYRNLTAAAAACFLLIMILGGMPPVQTLRQVLTGSLPQMGADRAKITAEEELLLLEKNGLPGGLAGQGDALTADDTGAESFGIMQQEGMESTPLLDDELLRQQLSPPGAGEMLLPQDMAPADTRELSFDTLASFTSFLQEHRDLAPGKLLYLAAPPEGYRFRQGSITKTDTSLTGLSQEFISPEGVWLIVQQVFLVDITVMIDEPTEKKPETFADEEPVYDFFTLNGSNIMKWNREDSMITINSPLDEDNLLIISEHLAALN